MYNVCRDAGVRLWPSIVSFLRIHPAIQAAFQHSSSQPSSSSSSTLFRIICFCTHLLFPDNIGDKPLQERCNSFMQSFNSVSFKFQDFFEIPILLPLAFVIRVIRMVGMTVAGIIATQKGKNLRSGRGGEVGGRVHMPLPMPSMPHNVMFRHHLRHHRRHPT